MKGLLLLSGGIDSPVAGYLMLQKGVKLEAVYFDTFSLNGSTALSVVEKHAKLLGVKLHVVPYGEVLKAYFDSADRKYQCVFCKRTMLRFAEKIAESIGADFLVNGDNLGQVASQTLRNLITVSEAVKIPIVRPLIGFDKIEIIKIAKEIGSYDVSTSSKLCCSFVPRKPSTSCSVERIKGEEEKVNIDELLDKYLKKEKVIPVN